MENICEWKNCKKIGSFKAPIEKDNSKKFKWLCEDHIKIHNKEWDYFKGMSQDDIEFFIKSDSTWHRPTQKFGSRDNFFNILWNNALSDKINMLNGKNSKHFSSARSLSEKDKEAFKIMGLKYDSNWILVQKAFKTLVKKFHPDRNAGNKLFENKLKQITLAYTHLKKILINKIQI